MRRRKILAINMLFFLIVSNLPIFGLSGEKADINCAKFFKNQSIIDKINYEPHDPIRINGEDEFTSENGVRNGNGSKENPYIIENLEIDGGGYEYCIYIGNTKSYFVIRSCRLYNASGNGLVFSNVKNGTIINVSVYNNMWDGIHLSYSENIYFGNNTVEKNRLDGFCIKNSIHITLKNNTISKNRRGIFLENSSHNVITYNRIKLHKGTPFRLGPSGLAIWVSNNNTISNNHILNNSYGIFLRDSNGNLIYNNYFNSLWVNAKDNGYNTWNTTRNCTRKNIRGSGCMGGNYWNDYKGHDRNRDGLGDEKIPYNCRGQIKNGGDYLPLTKKNHAPIANFTFEVEEDGLTVKFYDKSNDSDGHINAWYWDFGDGSKSGQKNPTHKFKERKVYYVNLTVEDDNTTRNYTIKPVDLAKRPYVEIELYWGKFRWPKKMPLISAIAFFIQKRIFGSETPMRVDTLVIGNITFRVIISPNITRVELYLYDILLYSDNKSFSYTFKPPFAICDIWAKGYTSEGHVSDHIWLLSLNIFQPYPE